MYIVGQILGGTIPMLLISWLFRKVARVGITARTALFSCSAAMLFAVVISSFAEGEGGFSNRLANIGSFESFLVYVPAAVIAFLLTYFYGLAKNESDREET